MDRHQDKGSQQHPCLYFKDPLIPYQSFRAFNLLLSLSFFFFPCCTSHLCDLSFLTRDPTCAPCSGSTES